MNRSQEIFIRKSISEFAAAHQLDLDAHDLQKALNLFFECGRQWSEHPAKSVEEIAHSMGLSQSDEHICKVVLDVWTDVYFD